MFSQYVWEQLYSTSPISGREVGTLYNLRQQFKMVNVYSDVKKNYKSAELLMLSATKAYLCCAFMQWTGMETVSAKPVNIKLPDPETSTQDERIEFLKSTVGRFVEEFVLVECNVEHVWREQQEQRRQQRCHVESAESMQAMPCPPPRGGSSALNIQFATGMSEKKHVIIAKKCIVKLRTVPINTQIFLQCLLLCGKSRF